MNSRVRDQLCVFPARYPRFEYLGDAAPYIDGILGRLDHVPIFSGPGFEEISSMAPCLNCFAAPGGKALIHEGDHGNFLTLILSGRIMASAA